MTLTHPTTPASPLPPSSATPVAPDVTAWGQLGMSLNLDSNMIAIGISQLLLSLGSELNSWIQMLLYHSGFVPLLIGAERRQQLR